MRMLDSSIPEILVRAKVAGPTLTAAAAASCIPTGCGFVFPGGYFKIERALWGCVRGKISIPTPTPGSARFDIRLGGTVIFDGLAVPLHATVAKTNVHFRFEFELTARAEGSTANFMGAGSFISEAVVGSPLPSAGGSGEILLPYNTAPAVGNNVDARADLAFDMQYTQVVATASLTVEQFWLASA